MVYINYTMAISYYQKFVWILDLLYIIWWNKLLKIHPPIKSAVSFEPEPFVVPAAMVFFYILIADHVCCKVSTWGRLLKLYVVKFWKWSTPSVPI
jgi:hypothetical protein